MESYRDTIIFVSVAVYMLICVLVGLWALRRTRSTDDFFMAGRNLGVFLTAFAVFSSTLSGFGFVGGPGLVYKMGMSSVWMVVCAGMGYVISYSLLGKRIRILGELRNCVSLPDVAAARYNSSSVRISVAVAIVLGVLGYLATQIKAMAVVLVSILDKEQFFPGISLEWCVIVSCAVLVFYSVTGGIIASVYTDLIQGAVMMVAAGLIFFTVLDTFDGGGMTAIGEKILEDDPEAISPWGTMGMIGCLSWFFVFGLGGSGQPHVITKLMMNKKVSHIRSIMPVATLGYFVSALLWIGIGLAMRALVVSGQHSPLLDPDAAAPEFLLQYAAPLLAGVVFAGLFAAIMSTADGFLNIGTAAIMHDIPKGLKKVIPNELLWARLTTVLITIVAALIALYSGDLVALLGAFGWGTFAAALVPVMAIGLNWKRATPLAANTAVISSLLINFGFKYFNVPMPYHIDVGAFSLVVSLVLFIGISLYSRPPKLDPDIDAAMDL